MFTNEFLIDTLSREDVRDLRLVELVDEDEDGDEDGDETFTRGDKLETDTLSFDELEAPFRSTELDRWLLRVNLSILKSFCFMDYVLATDKHKMVDFLCHLIYKHNTLT